MGSGFIVGVALARVYGPEGLGLITTASAAVNVVLGFSTLGLSGVLIKEFVKRPDRTRAILATITIAKFLAGVLLFMALLIGLHLLSTDRQLWVIVLIMGCGFVFSCFDTFDSLLQAEHQFGTLVLLRLVATVFSLAVKLLAIALEWGLAVVALGYALDFCLMYFLPFLRWILIRGWRAYPPTKSIDPTEFTGLLKQSWPVIVSGAFAQLNLRADQLIVASLMSIGDAGIYAAAVRLSEAWSLAATAVVAAIFPHLVVAARDRSAEYARSLERLLRILLSLSLVGAIVVAILSPVIIALVYGQEFSAAAPVLAIHVFGGLFLFVRTAVSRWLIIEHLLKLSLVSHLCGAVVNIGLNFVLIPAYGVVGAAWSSVFSYLVSGVLFLAIHRSSRPMLYLIATALVPTRLKGDLTKRIVLTMPSQRKQGFDDAN